VLAKQADILRANKMGKLRQRRGGLDSSFAAMQEALATTEKALAHVNTRVSSCVLWLAGCAGLQAPCLRVTCSAAAAYYQVLRRLELPVMCMLCSCHVSSAMDMWLLCLPGCWCLLAPCLFVLLQAAGLKHIGFGPFKRENQDEFFIQVGEFGGLHSSNLFCVFDGHGTYGKDAALYSRQLLPRLLDVEMTKYFQVC
jgi:hypothetical protein